jgi:hypothetical protein
VNFTVAGAAKLVPVIVTPVPIFPEVGVKPVIVGVAANAGGANNAPPARTSITSKPISHFLIAPSDLSYFTSSPSRTSPRTTQYRIIPHG